MCVLGCVGCFGRQLNNLPIVNTLAAFDLMIRYLSLHLRKFVSMILSVLTLVFVIHTNRIHN